MVEAESDDEGPPSQSVWEFTSNCELCGARLWTRNYIIQRSLNDQTRRVGCECVKRFSTLRDLADGLDVSTYVDNWTREQEYAHAIRTLAGAMMSKVVDRQAVYEFHRTVNSIFGPIKEPRDWERHGPRLLEIAKVEPRTWLAERIRTVLLYPTTVDLTAAVGSKPREESEAELRRKYGWRKPSKQKRGRAWLMTGRSDQYYQNRLDPFKKD